MTDLVPLLAAIDARSLDAIIATIDELPSVMPALQAWIDHAARWEADRRRALHYPLREPTAAILQDELPAAIGAIAMICQCFRHERRSDVTAVLAFFEGLRDALQARQAGGRPPLH